MLSARSFLQSQQFDERGRGAITALDSAIHEAEPLDARMLAGKLHAAVKSRLRSHFHERGVLADPCAGVASERGLAKMAPKIAESLDPLAVAAFFWATYPYRNRAARAVTPRER
jgi:hypothetical protein